MDHCCYLCFVFVMVPCLFIAALWSPAGKGLFSCCLARFLMLIHLYVGFVLSSGFKMFFTLFLV